MLTQLLSRATVEGSDGLRQDAAGSDFERSSSSFAVVLVARATNRVGYSVVDWPSQRHALICYMPTVLHMTRQQRQAPKRLFPTCLSLRTARENAA